MTPKTEITRADLMPLDDYAKVRVEKRRAITALKKDRRIAVGPDATFHFESYETMWQQVHEMLFIEKGGEEQVADELRAYNPLIPKGRELVATLMFEIDEPGRRQRVLGALGGVEDTVTLSFGDFTVRAVPEDDVERTAESGKTSSVHFLHFPFSDDQVKVFAEPGTRVILAIGHAGYDHMAALPEAVREALSRDFS